MKNLQAVIRRNIDFKFNVAGYCVDSDNGIVFVLTKELKLVKTLIYNEDIAPEERSLDEKFSALIGVTSLSQNDVKLFEFVVEVGGLLLALKSGHLLIISVSSTDCHCIYKHKCDISSISLSPSQDLIALADEENNIQVMFSSDCDISHQSNALTQNESLHKPVGVGWGSKETQFFGLDGRPSQERKQPPQIQLTPDEVTISDQIESSSKFKAFLNGQKKSTVIDWRGDGQLIATLTYLPETDKHYLKVWNRNLDLQYMSEQLVTVERGLLCWIPDGRYICCAQRRDRRLNELTLFEKNGLVRQRISLPSIMADMYISNMAWSSDSRIYATIVKQFYVSDGEVDFHNILMLYTMQNWHYYLKTSIKLRNDCDYSLKWDASNINRLHLMSTNGIYVEFDCCFKTTHSDQYSTIAVIDGNKVLVTPLETCIIPPPMSAITLELKSPVNKLALDHEANFYILTFDGQLICTVNFITNDEKTDDTMKIILNNQMSRKLHERLINYRIFVLDEADTYQHLVPIDEFNLLTSKSTPTGSELILIKLPGINANELKFEKLATFEKRQVACISRSTTKHSNHLNLILDDSSSFLLDVKGSILPTSDFNFNLDNSKFSYNFTDLQIVDSLQTKALISLGQDHCLRFNTVHTGNILASNSCNSFRLTENYLIYTTSENSIHFILLKYLSDFKINDNSDSWSQQIENGGTLIAVSEKNSNVILQMPRGNLETIHPRVLLFSKLTDLLDKGMYVEASKLARRHRVNMNFLVDYLSRLDDNYESYWTSLVEAVANYDTNLLCLIITELENEDTISGRYQNIVKHLPTRRFNAQEKMFEVTDKVNKFCSQINLPEESKFLYPRIQSLLRREPKMTRDALEIVHSLNQDQRMDATKYILYSIDIDQLFKDALSTYNLDIALMVASASNKDPKQYLADLDALNSVECETLRCFKIDVLIKRYDRAFNNLYSLYLRDIDITDELVLEFVVSKRIYKHAIYYLQSLSSHTDTYEFKAPFEFESRFKDRSTYLLHCVWAAYADYLLEKRHHNEAGLAYCKALNLYGCENQYLDSALKCYSFIEDWEKSMALIMRVIQGLGAKRQMARKLAKQLTERGKYCEAIIVEQQLDFGGEIKPDLLLGPIVDSGNFYLAEILAGHDREQFFQLTKQVDLFEQAKARHEDWSADLNTAKNQFERLKEVLASQKTRHDLAPESGFITDSLSTVDGSELSSMSGSDDQQVAKVARSGATSIKTRNSSKSNNSSHKRINLKAGSRHEDIALILELKKFMLKQKTNHEECVKFSAILFQYLSSTARAYDELNRFNSVLKKSLEFAQEVSELLWPTSPHLEQRYSLYKRLNNMSENPENIDFEILIRPELPKCLNLFDI